MIIPFLISLVAGLSTVLGVGVVFLKFKEKSINKIIAFFLSFSLGIMILISITDLIPESFFALLASYGLVKGQYISVVAFMIGYLIITILNHRIEKTSKDNLYKLGVLSATALVIHNFPEGIATFMSSYTDISLGLKLGFAIMLHNIPEGIAIAIPIYYSTKSKVKAFKYALISGLAEPVGALAAYFFLKDFISANLINIILIFVGGLMITLAIKEIFPKATSYKENRYLNLGIIISILFFLILNIIVG